MSRSLMPGSRRQFCIGDSAPEGGELYVLDHLWERQSPFNVEEAVAEPANILRQYGLDQVTGDKYVIGFVDAAFRRQRQPITYTTSEQNKSALYLEALPLFTTGRVRLLHNARLIHQLTSLERRTSAIGRDVVSHPITKMLAMTWPILAAAHWY